MERLETKNVNGNVYYYYSQWAWVNGKCRRQWQKYLGKLEDIVKACEGGPPVEYAEVFQWGLPSALWQECALTRVVEITDALCPKRQQGLSVGQYLAIAAINRAICPSSKRSMWKWFAQTVLLRHMPGASKETLSSQRFWDHMNKVDEDSCFSIWKNILHGVLQREKIDLSSISYDGTNFYSFINTFNTRADIAARGKNKQGRNNLRQVSYALFCCADGHMPLFFDIYEGNRHDTKEFPGMLEKFNSFLGEISTQRCEPQDVTLIFDKGNNSKDNFALLDDTKMHYVGSVKLDEHKDLAQISNQDERFEPCQSPDLKGSKAFRVKKQVYGKKHIIVVSYNQNLFNNQWMTLQNDIHKAMKKLHTLSQKLQDRASGLIKGGKTPTVQSVQNQCNRILSRQYMKQIFNIEIAKDHKGIPQLEYSIDSDSLNEISNTRLGKTLIITSRESWDDERIIRAYRSQFVIENVFKEMKDRNYGTWWPMHHWTTSKIKVHGLYCSIALLLRALIWRRVNQKGLSLPMKRLLSELDDIREVVNVYPKKRGQKSPRQQSVLTRRSELQEKLINILELK